MMSAPTLLIAVMIMQYVLILLALSIVHVSLVILEMESTAMVWNHIDSSNLQYTFVEKDIDECIEQTDNCDNNAHCYNTDGGFACICKDGFIGDGVNCEGSIKIIELIFDCTV